MWPIASFGCLQQFGHFLREADIAQVDHSTALRAAEPGGKAKPGQALPAWFLPPAAGERALLAAEAALASGRRQPMARALAAIQRAGRELPMGHRSSHGQASWRQRFKAVARALADKMAAAS